MNKIKLLFLVLPIIFVLPSLYGLFHPGLFVSDDGNWMVVRYSAFYETLRDGQFPVRYIFRLNNSFGYPVSNFLYPLFMYLAVPIHILGFNFVNSIKLIFGLSIIGSVIFSFLWLRKKFDDISSMVGAVAYTLFPYHLYDIFQRGSLGEALAFAILPFILWQVERKSFILFALGIAFLILSHNSLALILLPVIVGYVLIANRKRIKTNILAFVLAVGLSAFFWGPALWDKQYVMFDNTVVSNFSSYFISFQSVGLLGIVTLFSLLFSIPFLIKKKRGLFIYFFAIAIFFSFLVFEVSSFIWNILPSNLIQFPFRLLSVVCLAVAFLVAQSLFTSKGRYKIIFSAIFIVVIFASSFNYIFPKEYQYHPDTFYSTNLSTTTVQNEYLPKWVEKIPEYKPEKVEVVEGKAAIKNLSLKGTVSFEVEAEEESTVSINYIYFPGWQVKINGNKVDVRHDNPSGLIRFDVPTGRSKVSASFNETPARLTFDFISVLSLLILIGLAIKKPKFLK